MRPLPNLVGTKFHRLTVIDSAAYISPSGKKSTKWICKCDCGNLTQVFTGALKTGETKSCGCFKKEVDGKHTFKHGHASKKKPSVEYTTWVSIIRRCHSPEAENYPLYGGRGIQVCDRWRNSFEDFLQDMGPKPPNMSIERKENNGNYEPGNCRWATVKEQANNRRNNIIIEFNGTKDTLSNWCGRLDLNYRSVWRKINRGASFEEAISA